MDDAVGRARGRSFGSVADLYERSRPGYPPDAVRWMLGADVVANVPAGKSAVPRVAPSTVVELAAGTGKLTRHLVDDGHWVVAMEPAKPMLDRMARHVRSAFGVQAQAEAIPLVDGCADAVVVGQAFHWFDTERALAEVGRVLRPGGVLGLVWNRRDESVPWVRHLSTLLARDDPYDEQWVEELVETIDVSRRFGEVEASSFRLWQRLDREGLIQLVASRSYVATLSPGDRQSVLEQVGWLYDATATQPDGLILPYRTVCYRVRRA